jgi:replicative DNA helicase
MLENKLLSKVLICKEILPLFKGNVVADDFYTQGDTYNYIKEYYKEYGEVPPMETVVSDCDSFEYVGEVPDKFEYLINSIKDATSKRVAYELLQNEAGNKFSTLSGVAFSDWLLQEATRLNRLSHVNSTTGTNFAVNGKDRKAEYLERKEKKSGSFIQTPYPSLNTWLGGGMELGDYTLLNAYTNRGKSWIAGDFGVMAWRKGFGVLHYSPELSKSQQMDRLDTLNGHFDNMELKTGNLKHEEKYLTYLDTFDESNEVPYIIKTMDDLSNGLSLEVIEADIQANSDIKLVIIDGFNLMSHTGSSGSSKRDKMSSTSREIRQLFGKYGISVLVVHHTPTSAEKENKETDEAGTRIVKPPEIHQYSETVAVIQDACTVLTFDQRDGIGALKLAKARTPFVDQQIELHCDFNLGIIREVSPVDYF